MLPSPLSEELPQGKVTVQVRLFNNKEDTSVEGCGKVGQDLGQDGVLARNGGWDS